MEHGRIDKSNTLIVHAITKLDLGGAQKIVLAILKYLNGKGYKTLLICGEGGKLLPEFKRNGINIIVVKELKREINPIYDIKALIKITRVLKSLRKCYDNVIVHTHTPKAGIIVRLSAYFAGIDKIYHTVHGWGFHNGQNAISRTFFILIEKLVANITKKMVAVSNYVKDIGVKYGIGNRSKYIVIRNGIETVKKKKNNNIYKKFGITAKNKIILQVSSLKPPKSPIDFAKIANKLKTNKNLTFIISGGGELKDPIEKYIQQNDLDNILLLDWYEDIEELYGIADLFTLTSISEGMPLAILEAVNFNIPIIATNIKPIKEILPKYGYLCPPHDIDCFVKNINKLLKSSRNIKYDLKFKEKDMLKEYERLLYLSR